MHKYLLFGGLIGLASASCSAGYWGQSANKDYLDVDCTLPCGHCGGDGSCNIATGVCTSGCKDGWTGDSCDKAKCSGCGGGVCIAPDICRCPQLYTRLIEKDGDEIKKITCENQSATGMIGFAGSMGVLAVVLLFFTYFDQIRAGLGYGKCKPE